MESLLPDFLLPMTMTGCQDFLSWSKAMTSSTTLLLGCLTVLFDLEVTKVGGTMKGLNSPKSHISPICDWHWLWTVLWHQQHLTSTIPGPSPQTSSHTSHSEWSGRLPGIQWCLNFWFRFWIWRCCCCNWPSDAAMALQVCVALAFLMHEAWMQQPMPQLEQNCPFVLKSKSYKAI